MHWHLELGEQRLLVSIESLKLKAILMTLVLVIGGRHCVTRQ